MLTKIHGKHTFECNSCGEVLSTDTADFAEALRTMREENWRAKQEAHGWVHTCFGCDDTATRNPRTKNGRML